MRFHLLALLALGVTGCKDKSDTGEATAAGEPDIAVTAAALDFGELAPGTTSTLDFTIQNRGDGDLYLSFATTPATATFSVPSGGLVVPSAEYRVDVTCVAPSAYGAVTATLEITSNDPDDPTIPLSLTCALEPDVDGDGFDTIAAGGDDCDDANPATHPGAPDDWYDGIDSDCDGSDDYDQDEDGFQTLAHNEDPAAGGGDCQDTNDEINPGMPDVWYDGVDSDCSGNDDFDQDGDGSASEAHGKGLDCDDTNPDVSSSAIEKLNGADDDCDGEIDVDVSAWNADFVYVGDAAMDQAGWSLAAGDLNLDGHDDLLVGAPAYDAELGLVGVFDGSNLPASGSTLLDGVSSFSGGSGERLGAYVAYQALGRNGDPSVAVGAPGYDAGAGAVYLLEGGDVFYGGTPSAAYLTITGEGESELGSGMAQNLDLNGDGVEDLFGRYVSGSSTYLWLSYGGTQGAIDLSEVDARFSTTGSSDVPPHSFPLAGDLDGDGEDDAVYCDHKVDSRGALYVLWGQTARYEYSDVLAIDDIGTKLFEGEPYEQLGRACGVGPDWDNDGDEELWLQVPDASGKISGIYLIAGSNSLDNGTFRPEDIYERYYAMRDSDPGAYAFGSVGDWDADGVGDVAFGLKPSGVSFGRAYLYGSDTPNTSPMDAEDDAIATLEGDDDFYQELFGSAVSQLPVDFNGDGLHDFVGGDYGYDGLAGSTADAGGVFVTLQLP